MSDLTLEDINYGRSGTYLFDRAVWKPKFGGNQPVFTLGRRDPRGPAMRLWGDWYRALECSGGALFYGKGRHSAVIAQGGRASGVLGQTEATGDGDAGVYGSCDKQTGAACGVIGLTANRDGVGVMGQSFLGTGVLGTSWSGGFGVQGASSGNGKAGVLGTNDASFKERPCYGVIGSNTSKKGAGVLGMSEPRGSAGVQGSSREGIGVWGYGHDGTGMMGMSGTFHAVVGSASAPTRCGVFGINAAGIGVGGKSMTGIGVLGISTTPGTFAGVAGVSTRGVGVSAHALDPKANAIGLYAKAPRVAAFFEGDVVIKGNLAVASGYKLTVLTPGNKNGVVAFADGSHRIVCAIESPEAWFEDFGEASLVKGKAHVGLDPGFAQTIDAKRYHVFLTPYGETAGLHVARRTKAGFDVAERKPGKSNVRFSWRVVARPKSTKHKRFAKTTTPQTLDRVHSAIARDNRRRSIDATLLKTDDIDMGVRSVPTLPKRAKPRLSKPPKLPDLPKRGELGVDSRRLMKQARKPIGG